MPPPPLRFARLLLGAMAAAVAAGSATDATRIPSHPEKPGVATIQGSAPPAPSTEPWFEMTVATSAVTFAEPAEMPPGAPPVKAEAGILVDMDSGEVLWERDQLQELPPASLTKVLTSLVALENLSPDRQVTITADALGQASDDTDMGLKVGEVLTVQELLDGMLLPSGDDAASAIAVDTVGELRFVAAMNAQVAALGLQGAHFSNTSGLDDPELYASAYDLAVIATFTYDHYPLFDRIVDTPNIALPATPGHPAFKLWNLDALLQDYPAAVGIKPGWTGNAGACLIGMAVRDGHRLLAVLLNASYPAQLEARLIDWGFEVEGLAPLLPPTPTPSPAPTPGAGAAA